LSGGSGFIDLIKQTDASNYELKGKVTTRHGARTCLFIPELKQLLLAGSFFND
jgi:hypothetical protein